MPRSVQLSPSQWVTHGLIPLVILLIGALA
jgi:hypothetical protein